MNRLRCLPRIVAAGTLVGALAAMGTSVALAQSGPPQATLMSVTPTGTDSMQVQGSINPNGSPTTWVVRYGTTPVLGQTTPTSPPEAPPQGSSIPVQAALGGLNAGTTYYVQLVATNSNGSSASAVMSARTESAPPSPSGPAPPKPSSPRQTYAKDVLAARVLAGRGALIGVSCVSGSLCYALGTLNGGMFLERWNGRSWRRVAVLRGTVPLGAISCTSRSFCLIVGSTGKLTFAARWSGRSLSRVATVSPPSSGSDLFNSVACVSARDCWAVGALHAATNTPRTLIEHWDGDRFRLASAPSVGSYLFSVSCASARDCWAVGLRNVTEHFGGSRWRLVRLPAAFNAGQPPAVSCRALTECWIVGQGKARPPRSPSIVALDLMGGSWRKVPIPYGARYGSNFIYGVDCASSTNCWAVGQSISGFRSVKYAPVAEEWDGSAWHIAKVTGNPGHGGYFNAVSCAPMRPCVAVGATANGGRIDTPVVAVTQPGS